MINMILKTATGKRMAIRAGDILEMHEADGPNRTLLLIGHGRDGGGELKPVVVEHEIEELFNKIVEVDRHFF